MRGFLVVVGVTVLVTGVAGPAMAQPTSTSEAPPSSSSVPPATTTPPTTTPPPTTTTPKPTTTTPPPTTTPPVTTVPPAGTSPTTVPPSSSTSTPVGPPVPTSAEMAKYWELSQAAALANEDALTAQQDLTDKKAALEKANAEAEKSKQAAADAVAAETRTAAAESLAKVSAEKLQAEIDHLVEISFKGLRLNGLAAIFSSDSPEEFLDAAMIMDVYAERHGDMVRAADNAAQDAVKAQTAAKEARIAVEATSKKAEEDRVTAQRLADESIAASAKAEQRKVDVDGKVGQVRTALNILTPADRTALGSIGPSISGIAIPAGTAGDALKFALAQLGKPYVWGAIGPDTYDCSGLMMTAYKSVGVTIPRTTYTQALIGNAVPRDQVRAGDLILYYTTVSHVAMAIDGTMAVHASTAGEPVKVSPIDAIGPIATIRRVTG
jgi:cell wall-associated NlpC family hydrolase